MALAGMMMRLVPAMAVAMTALLLGLVALGFLFAAVYLALSGAMPAPWAAAATAGVALVLALLVLAIGRLRDAHGGGAAAADAELPLPPSALALAVQLGEQAASFARLRPWSAAALSLLAGVSVGASPRLRLVLTELLRG